MSNGSQAFYIKRGDTSPSLGYVLASSVDLTDAVAVFSMRDARTKAVIIDAAAARVVTPTTMPTLAYDWQAGDTDTAGDFDAEFEVTLSGGAVETFPNVAFISVQIGDDIG